MRSSFVFDTQEEEQAFYQYLRGLRCMTCPNQSIADSEAPLALAMKEMIYHRFKQGESFAVIQQYLVSRYSHEILYQPPLLPATTILWASPLLFLVLGIFLWLRKA